MSPLLINEVLVKAIKVAMALVPAVLVLLLLLLMVTPEPLIVTWPAPV